MFYRFFFRNLLFLLVQLFILVGFSTTSFAQGVEEEKKFRQIDSLSMLFAKAPTDKKKITYLLQLAELHSETDTIKAKNYLKKAKTLADSIQQNSYYALYYNQIGIYYRLQKQYLKSKKFYDKAMDLALKAKNDTILAGVYFEMGRYFILQKEIDASIEMHKKALEIRIKYKNRKKIGESYNAVGLMYLKKNDYVSAQPYHIESLKIKQELVDKEGIGMEYNNLGTIYMKLNNFPIALDYFRKSIEVSKELKKIDQQVRVVGNIAGIYRYNGENEKALEYYQEALELAKEEGDDKLIRDAYLNLGISHKDLGNYKKASEYFEKTLKMTDIKVKNNSLSLVYRNIGDIYYLQKNYTQASPYYKKALEIVEIGGTSDFIAFTHYCIAKLYFDANKLQSAKKEANISIELSRKFGFHVFEKNGIAILAQIEFANKNYKEAFKLLSRAEVMKDSINREQKHKELADSRAIFESDKNKEKAEILAAKDRENTIKLEVAATKSKLQNWIMGFILVTIVGLGIFIIVITKKNKVVKKSQIELAAKNIEIQSKKEALEKTLSELKIAQNQLIESEKMASLGNLVAGVAHEMNTPIGIGVQANSGILNRTIQIISDIKTQNISKLNMLKYIEHTYESSKLALSNLQRTAELIKSFKLVSVDQSVENVRKFKILEYFNEVLISFSSTLKKQNIEVEIDCNKDLEIKSYPGAFAQILTNLVINALNHGFKDKTDGKIHITVKKEGETFFMTFSDTGKGMTPEVCTKIFDPFFTTNKQTGTGLGLHITYNLITQKLKGNISCESEVNIGSTFHITFHEFAA